MIVSDDRVARFVSERIGKGFVPPFTAMGIERDGEIVGGCIFNVFESDDLHVSLAGVGWTREFIRAVGQYVYDGLGYARITALTESEKVAAYAVRLGGQVEGRMRCHFGPGRDAIIVGILKDDWRYGNKAPLAHG